MKLHVIEEPPLMFAQGGRHVDIKAGLSTFGAFDRGSGSVPDPIGIGLIGTADTIDGVRDWMESCRNGVASTEETLTNIT